MMRNNLRTVIAQATSGGRSFVSRRNFSSPPPVSMTEQTIAYYKTELHKTYALGEGLLTGFVGIIATGTLKIALLRRELNQEYKAKMQAEAQAQEGNN